MKSGSSIFLALLCAFLTVACSKDFFNQYPSNKTTDDKVYLTDDDFNQAVRGCYAKLTAQLSWHINELAYRADEALLEDMTTSTQERYANDHFQELSTAGMFQDIWSAWYNGIDRCNDLLDHIASTSLSLPDTYQAEGRFLRAWFYFNLYRTFGVVPIVKTVVSKEKALTIPRCGTSEMLDFLKEDLSFAAAHLPASRPKESARVTSMAAKALLAKVYLTFGKYPEAEEVLSGIQSDSFYGLMPTTADVFDCTQKMNKEMIFVVYFDNTNDSGHGAWWSVSSLTDIKNPDPTFLANYDGADNRLPLISTYKTVSSTNHLMLKWYTPFDAVYTTQVSSDFPHLRYADVVLMMAEALGRQGKIGDALPYLNKTRTRAGLPALTSADVSTSDQFIQALADERGKEFALEGQRWYDLVRLGLAVDCFKNAGYTIDNHNLLFPIPWEEIHIVDNSAILWQNPGF